MTSFELDAEYLLHYQILSRDIQNIQRDQDFRNCQDSWSIQVRICQNFQISKPMKTQNIQELRASNLYAESLESLHSCETRTFRIFLNIFPQ